MEPIAPYIEAGPHLPAMPQDRAHLLFHVGAERLAVPLSRVSGVIRLPEIMDVPLSPAGVEGLANLRGTVTAIVGLHRLLGTARAEATAASRVIVIEHATPVALLADRLSGVVEIAPDRIEAAGEEHATGDILAGLYSTGEGEPAVLVLDPDRTLDRIFTTVAKTARQPLPAARADRAGARGSNVAERLLISFEADRQEYAIPIAAVREIVSLPPNVSRVPRAQSHVLGVVTLRGRLVPLVSARTLLGLPRGAGEERAQVLVISPDADATVGLVIDRAREILRIREDEADPVPALLARDAVGDIEAICRLEGGQRLVSILSPGHLLRSDAVIQALAAGASQEKAAMPEQETGAVGVTEQFIVFRLGKGEYGLPIGAVDEIVRVPELLTEVPQAPAHMAGIINHRGAVLPVIDQRRRFGMAAAGTAQRHIVVLSLRGLRIGFLVDGVTGVQRIPVDAISEAPALSAEQAKVITRIARLADRMILLLSPESLVNAEEAGSLADMASGAADGGE